MYFFAIFLFIKNYFKDSLKDIDIQKYNCFKKKHVRLKMLFYVAFGTENTSVIFILKRELHAYKFIQ